MDKNKKRYLKIHAIFAKYLLAFEATSFVYIYSPSVSKVLLGFGLAGIAVSMPALVGGYFLNYMLRNLNCYYGIIRFFYHVGFLGGILWISSLLGLYANQINPAVLPVQFVRHIPLFFITISLFIQGISIVCVNKKIKAEHRIDI